MSAPVHLISVEEHDTTPDVFCAASEYDGPRHCRLQARDPVESTCIACLWAAVAHGERLARDARARIVTLAPTNPAEIERPVERVRDAAHTAGSIRTDNGYKWEREAVDELLRYLGVEGEK